MSSVYNEIEKKMDELLGLCIENKGSSGVMVG